MVDETGYIIRVKDSSYGDYYRGTLARVVSMGIWITGEPYVCCEIILSNYQQVLLALDTGSFSPMFYGELPDELLTLFSGEYEVIGTHHFR